MTGSHYDTVRNGGKYDGRLGIFVPMACVRELHRQGRRLALSPGSDRLRRGGGQRYAATFLLGARWSATCRNGWTSATPRAPRCAKPCSTPACASTTSPRCARSRALPGFRRSAHRTRPGVVRDGPAAGRGHLDQRQRALPGPHRRHGQPCRHHTPWTAGATAAATAELALYLETAARRATAIRSAPWACWTCPTARSTWCPANAASA